MIEHEMLQLFYKFFLSLVLGALIGIEREKSQQRHEGTDFAGIRTFMIISFFGTITAYLASLYYDWLLAVIIGCFIALLMAGYILSSIFNKNIGMTTELSAVISFIIGILVFTAPQEIPILLTIVIALLLSFKSHLHKFVYQLKLSEFFDTIKFLLIAFVVLPLLKPIEPFGPFNAINLYEIWLMVVFVSTISYVGYILMKAFGSSRGTLVTGLLGGILSSTAVVTSLASNTKEKQVSITPAVAAAALASATMFVRVLIEVSILNFGLIEKLAMPMMLMATACFISVSILWKKNKVTDTELDISSPLKLKPALKFGFFYGFILLISNIFNAYFGTKGLLIAGLISGLADVDAITIYVARNTAIATPVAVLAVTIAATVNTIVKVIIAKIFGNDKFGSKLMKVLAPAIITGLILIAIL